MGLILYHLSPNNKGKKVKSKELGVKEVPLILTLYLA